MDVSPTGLVMAIPKPAQLIACGRLVSVYEGEGCSLVSSQLHYIQEIFLKAQVFEMVYVGDLKSLGACTLRVRVSPWAF